jgi:hypothetical protein
MSRASWLVLLCVLVLALSPCVAQGQISPQTSSTPEPLWQELLKVTQKFPNSLDLFLDNLQKQIGLLQDSNQLLSDSVKLLQDKNESLTASLLKSQEALAISESLLKQSQTDLSASTVSIIKAQGEAKKVLFENSLLKIGLYITVPVAVIGTAYVVGRIVKWW